MVQEMLIIAGVASSTFFLVVVIVLLFSALAKRNKESSRISEDLETIKSQISGSNSKRVSRKLR